MNLTVELEEKNPNHALIFLVIISLTPPLIIITITATITIIIIIIIR